MTSSGTSFPLVPPRALFESFERQARAAPERMIARTAGDGFSMNAAALLYRVESTARTLAHEGVARGDLVLLAGLGGIPFTEALLAVWACDAVALPADAQLAPAEVETLRALFRPRAMVGPGGSGRLQVEALRAACPPMPDGAALVKLTSGSTGRPRGILATAAQLLADARHIRDGLGITPDDVCISAVPLSHSYGMANVLLQLVQQGSPFLVVPGPLPELLAGALSIEEPAVFAGVPYLFEMLIREGAPAWRRRGLRVCLSAAAPLRPSTAAGFFERFGLAPRSFYGTSETGGITFDSSSEGDAAIVADGCVGTALPGVDVTVEEDEGRVVVRGPNVSSGYLAPAGPEESDAPEAVFQDGAFRTSDTGRIDERGRLHLTGRVGAVVNVSGRKVDPREIERSLTQLAGVEETAVMGMEDGVRGQALVAFIAGASLTREKVMTHLRDRLAPYKMPRRVIFVDALPRSPRGKLDRETLRRQAMEKAHDEA